MPVYVDNQQNPYRGMKMCHMLADSTPELHAMADKLGLKRQWFQDNGTPHYDICQAKRKLAISFGAIEADRYKVVELIRSYRSQK